MAKPGGYALTLGPEGIVFEADTITCSHCNRIVTLGREADFGHCLVCDKDLCGPCVDIGECIPFKKKCDRAEAEYYRKQQNAKILGI